MRVAVSFLTSDPAEMTAEKIKEKLPALEDAGADTIQWDLMDGKYNGNNTLTWFTWDLIKDVANHTRLGGEAHLMVVSPWDMVKDIAPYVSLIIFHIESCLSESDVRNTINKIKELHKKVGIALEPDTHVDYVFKFLPDIDNVLIMTVRTGYAGQSYIDQSEKIRTLRTMIDNHKYNVEIEVDGGMNAKTVETVRNAGATAINSATFILKNEYKEAISQLKAH